jgi:FAD/FMN-containing dehydrogenase
VFFLSDEDALAAVENWRAIARLNMLEYMDAASLALLRPRYGSAIPAGARAALLVEQDLDGLPGEPIDEWLDRLERSGGLEESWFGETAGDRERFRAFRHALPELVNERVRANGVQKLGSDFAVPIERNAEMLAWYRETLESGFPGRHTLYGHIGDAHVHANILSQDAAEYARGRAWLLETARQAVRLGGTVSAEHGLGRRKRHLLEIQFSPAEVEALRAVKRQLDPAGLLGPGILFSETPVTD